MDTGAAPPPPEPPPPPPEHVLVVEVPPGVLLPPVAVARPTRGYEASSVVAGLAGPPPGVTTYRLRGTETTQVE